MNNFADSKRIDVEFLDASKAREFRWSVPLASGDRTRKLRHVGEQLLDITILRRIGCEWRPRHVVSR